jgi:hypothetical protein
MLKVRGFAALRLCVKVKGEQAKAKAQAEEVNSEQ